MKTNNRPWLCGRVPDGYWDLRPNRQEYLRWLAARYCFVEQEDWYQLRRRHFAANFGGGLLKNVYGDSILAALRDWDPDAAWQPWKLGAVPHGYWDDPLHRREYMTWLQGQLRYSQVQEWYDVRKRDFHNNFGGGLLAGWYGDSPQQAVLEYLPEFPWKPWMFHSVPQEYWQRVENRQAYLAWLGGQLGFTSPTDWYRLTTSDLRRNRGGGLLDYYHNGPLFKAVVDALGSSRRSRKSPLWPLIQLIESSAVGGVPTVFLQSSSHLAS